MDRGADQKNPPGIKPVFRRNEQTRSTQRLPKILSRPRPQREELSQPGKRVFRAMLQLTSRQASRDQMVGGQHFGDSKGPSPP